MPKPIVAGIVTEYNPFHAGHEWMIQLLRRGGVNTIVCVMSGAFVQRAEPALLPTALRARAALAAGADLVLRLPVGWAAASAEGFAAGAAGLLAGLGCVDILAFGAETPDADILLKAAELLNSEALNLALKPELAKGLPFAAARAAAAEKLQPGVGKTLRSPNNILGIEYCKALQHSIPAALRQAMPEDVRQAVVSGLFGTRTGEENLYAMPVPLALPRLGASHDGHPVEGVASASWLRTLCRKEGMAALAPYVPAACLPLYKEAEAMGAVSSPSRWEIAVLSRLRGLNAEQLAAFPNSGDGLAPRLAGAATRALTLEEMYAGAKSKRFAHSRVRRLTLAAVLGLPAQQPVIPPFAQVLAANQKGLSLLRQAKQRALLPVGTSLAKLAKTSPQALAAAQLEATAEDLFALCLQNPQPGGNAYTQPAAFVTGSHST